MRCEALTGRGVAVCLELGALLWSVCEHVLLPGPEAGVKRKLRLRGYSLTTHCFLMRSRKGAPNILR